MTESLAIFAWPLKELPVVRLETSRGISNKPEALTPGVDNGAGYAELLSIKADMDLGAIALGLYTMGYAKWS
jgi:hypothetical protein